MSRGGKKKTLVAKKDHHKGARFEMHGWVIVEARSSAKKGEELTQAPSDFARLKT